MTPLIIIAVIAVTIILHAGLIYVFGPIEPRGWKRNNPTVPQQAAEIDAFLQAREAGHPIKPGLEKQVRWAGSEGEKTDWVLVYFHGFTASRLELDPTVDRIGDALGANIYYQRFDGHGLDDDGARLGQVHYADWVADAEEAMLLAPALGRRVALMSCSNGGSMSVWVAQHMPGSVDAFVFVSPNFRINSPFTPVLTLPWGQRLTEIAEGKRRRWDDEPWWGEEERTRAYNAGTGEHPTRAVLPVAVASLHARQAPLADFQQPALFVIDLADKTSDQRYVQKKVFPVWGGKNKRWVDVVSQHSNRHVICGDLCSAGTTDQVVETTVEFIRNLD